MEVIVNLINDLIGGKTSIGRRFANFIIIITVALIVDYSLKFTYNIFQTHKLEQLEAIETLKEKYKNNKNRLGEINRIEKDIFGNRHYYERLTDLLGEYFTNKINDNGVVIGESKKELDFYWTAISSSLAALIFIFLSFARPIWRWDFSFRKNMETYAIAIIVLGIVFGYTIFLMQFPVINMNPWINYSVYFALHLIFVILIVSSKRPKKES